MRAAPMLGSSLVKEAQDFACNMLPPGLLVVHNASAGGEDDIAELTGGEELDDPFLFKLARAP
jgi:hypothetical protein